jgi:hypothetical protein
MNRRRPRSTKAFGSVQTKVKEGMVHFVRPGPTPGEDRRHLRARPCNECVSTPRGARAMLLEPRVAAFGDRPVAREVGPRAWALGVVAPLAAGHEGAVEGESLRAFGG